MDFLGRRNPKSSLSMFAAQVLFLRLLEQVKNGKTAAAEDRLSRGGNTVLDLLALSSALHRKSPND